MSRAEFWVMRVVMPANDPRIEEADTVREAGRKGWVRLESGELAEPLQCFDRPIDANEHLVAIARPGETYVAVMNIDLD